MSRVLTMFSAAALTLLALRASAQAPAAPELALRIERGGDACFESSALRARVRHYLDPDAVPVSNLLVYIDATSRPPRFRIERGGTVVAERQFEALPPSCRERLDAVALAVALAI